MSLFLAIALLFALALHGAQAEDLVSSAPGRNAQERAGWVLDKAFNLTSRERIQENLRALVSRWPDTEAARLARRWLLEDAVVAGDWVLASELITEGFPSDSSGHTAFLRTLTEVALQRPFPDSTDGAVAPPENDPTWGELRLWIDARGNLEREPGGEALRRYLALEGRAREKGWLGLWLAGFLRAPRESAAWKAFLDIWGREKAAVRGSLEWGWIDRRVSRRTADESGDETASP